MRNGIPVKLFKCCSVLAMLVGSLTYSGLEPLTILSTLNHAYLELQNDNLPIPYSIKKLCPDSKEII